MAGYFDASVVALGSFNPAIFQPAWFKDHDILPANEIEAATTKGAPRLVVSNDVTSISFDALRLEVLQDRWQIITSRLDWKNDLGPIVGSIFRLLNHTPVHTVGLNFAIHRDVLGDPLAVVEQWVPVRRLAEAVGTPVALGATVRSTWESYRVSLSVEPSQRLRGVFVAQNYEQKVTGAKQLCDLLDADWLRVLRRAEEIANLICPAEGP
jgi:hypothetical protein